MATGWGNKSWGASEWGDLSDETVLTSSIAISSSIGSSTTQANSDVVVSGIAASYTIPGVVAGASADVFPNGISLSTTIGTTLTNIGVSVTGSSASSTIASITIEPTRLIGEGWGRGYFGEWAWGVNYSVALGGIALSTAIGNEDAFSDVVVAVSGIGLSADITPVGTSGTSDNEIAHSFLLNPTLGSVSLVGTGVVQLTGISLSTAISAAEAGLKTEVPVTGVSLQTTIGNEDITGNGLVVVTGTGVTASLGNSTPVSGYDVSGISATYATPGNVVVIGGATVVPTGIGLTITVASPNIIAWAEVDVGTPVTWSPVDLAA
jgi:hypothetical protein